MAVNTKFYKYGSFLWSIRIALKPNIEELMYASILTEMTIYNIFLLVLFISRSENCIPGLNYYLFVNNVVDNVNTIWGSPPTPHPPTHSHTHTEHANCSCSYSIVSNCNCSLNSWCTNYSTSAHSFRLSS